MTDDEPITPESDGGEGSDDRPGERRPIELKVEYKRLNTFFYDYTKNISKGGTFIKTDRPLDVGTVFLFRLMVPVAAQPIELRGEVRWVVKPGEPAALAAAAAGVPQDSGQPGMGIRFVFDGPAERIQLGRIVEKLMVGSLGQLIYSRLVGAAGTGAGPHLSSAVSASGPTGDEGDADGSVGLARHQR